MGSYVVTILPGGRITIPLAIRKELDLHPGDTLVYWLEGRKVYLRKVAELASLPVNNDDPEVKDKPEGNAR
jgi:AbrB family looped-hinge helix DNA binding protein